MAEAAVVALYGPTALGKTEVAIELAVRLGGEIVVADSMQVYAGLPILTNQPDAGQRTRARHHLVGFVRPQQEFTVAEYAERAREAIGALLSQGTPVVIEGGSGLYLRAALGGLDFLPVGEAGLRERLERRYAEDPSAMVAELCRLDAATHGRIDTTNPRRVVRALEAVLATGGPLNDEQRDQLWRPAELLPHRLVGLIPHDDRDVLRQRVDARIDEMIEAGALEEVRAARRSGPFSRTALQAIGVRELSAVLDGEIGVDEAMRRMRSRTRALVRRQLTWMRKLPTDALVDAGKGPAATAGRIHGQLGMGAW